ncbi:tetratricopeptide repeat protein, partial [Candidatus Poribacteria bacterium]|nr:tetratricopeptide repeat protein [Candidatus Poribacteria bacterium]
ARTADGESPDIYECLAELHKAAGNAAGLAVSLLWLGNHYRDKGALKKARERLEDGIAAAPGQVELQLAFADLLAAERRPDDAAGALVKAAEILVGRGDGEQAAQAVRRACELQPDSVGLRRNLADLLFTLGDTAGAAAEHLAIARIHLSQGLIDEARESLDKLYEREGRNRAVRESAARLFEENAIPELAAQEYSALARITLEDGDGGDAVRWCRRALALKSKDIEAHEVLVAASKSAGDINTAADTLSKLADLFLEGHAIEKAAKVLEALVAFRKDEPSAHERLADLYEKLGRSEELVWQLRTLASLQEERGEFDAAVNTLKRILGIRPDDTHVRTMYISAYSHVGNEADLIEDYLELARLHLGHGAREEAEFELRRAIAVAPENAKVRERWLAYVLEFGTPAEALDESRQYAELLVCQGRGREAVKVLERVADTGKNDPEYHVTLAQVHQVQNARGMALQSLDRAAALFAEAGNTERKAAVLEDILAIDPQKIEYHRELIGLLRAQEKDAKALAQQLKLAEVLLGRGLPDLAEAEYRNILTLDPHNEQAWLQLFQAHLLIGDESDLVSDYMTFADIMLQKERLNETLHYYTKVMRLDPASIEARLKYVEVYRRVGPEADLCNDYLTLADLFINAGRIDEGIALFSRVLSLDPKNLEAREKLSETQARLRQLGHAMPELDLDLDHNEPIGVPPRQADSDDTVGAGRGSASRLLAEAVFGMDEEDDRAALGQVIASYREILAINSQNANVRIKLADVLEQVNRPDEAMQELILASESLFQKGELDLCISICDRILKVNPTDQKVRVRLKQAFNKRDAFKALESAILFTNKTPRKQEPGTGRGTK